MEKSCLAPNPPPDRDSVPVSVCICMYVNGSRMYQYMCVHMCLHLRSVSDDDVVTVERAFSLMLRVTVMVTGKQKTLFSDMLWGMVPNGAKNTQQGLGIFLRDAFHTATKNLKGRQINTDSIRYRQIHTDTAWPGPPPHDSADSEAAALPCRAGRACAHLAQRLDSFNCFKLKLATASQLRPVGPGARLVTVRQCKHGFASVAAVISA
jgi:hypothetical protein